MTAEYWKSPAIIFICLNKLWLQEMGGVTFLSPNKKVTKEVGIGEALCVALPRAKAALSYVPHPAALFRRGAPYPTSGSKRKCSDFLFDGQFVQLSAGQGERSPCRRFIGKSIVLDS